MYIRFINNNLKLMKTFQIIACAVQSLSPEKKEIMVLIMSGAKTRAFKAATTNIARYNAARKIIDTRDRHAALYELVADQLREAIDNFVND